MVKLKRIIAAVLCVAMVTLTMTACGEKDGKAAAGDESNITKEAFVPAADQQVATISVENFGDIKVAFFPKSAPKAVENFVTHAKEGYYDGLTFHRIIKDFMIQGGDPEGTGVGGESIWGEPFEDEFSDNLRNFTGALCMANAGPKTNGSQFFIVDAPSVTKEMLETVDGIDMSKFSKDVLAKYEKDGGAPWLDGVHTVFGQVYEGMDVVRAIMDAEEAGKNTTPVTIKTITVSQYSAAK